MTTEFFRFSVAVACLAALPPKSLETNKMRRLKKTGSMNSTKKKLRMSAQREIWEMHFSGLMAGINVN